MDKSLFLPKEKDAINELQVINYIRELTKMIHQNAIDHGWWEEERSMGDLISLMHSELSEALEEHRNHRPNHYYHNLKPEGVAVELADVIIRILDWAGKEGIDMGKVIMEKHKFNEKRPYRHGGKRM